MTKGYKATYNYKCREQLYEIGQEYKMDEKPMICSSGFHYCLFARQVLKYYDYNSQFKLLEIEDLSEDTVKLSDKSCSNHIKAIREITDPDELYELLLIHSVFDEQGRELFHKEKNGYYWKKTYDEQGRELSFEEHPNKFYSETLYKRNGSIKTTRCETTGLSTESIFNIKGQTLSFKDNKNSWYKYTYNENGRVLTLKSSGDWNYEYTYHQNGSIASYKDPNGFSEYDMGGRLIKHVYLDARTKCPV